MIIMIIIINTDWIKSFNYLNEDTIITLCLVT